MLRKTKVSTYIFSPAAAFIVKTLCHLLRSEDFLKYEKHKPFDPVQKVEWKGKFKFW